MVLLISGTFVTLEFIILGFCSIHVTSTLAGLKNIVHRTKDFFIMGFFNQGSIVMATAICDIMLISTD